MSREPRSVESSTQSRIAFSNTFGNLALGDEANGRDNQRRIGKMGQTTPQLLGSRTCVWRFIDLKLVVNSIYRCEGFGIYSLQSAACSCEMLGRRNKPTVNAMEISICTPPFSLLLAGEDIGRVSAGQLGGCWAAHQLEYAVKESEWKSFERIRSRKVSIGTGGVADLPIASGLI